MTIYREVTDVEAYSLEMMSNKDYVMPESDRIATQIETGSMNAAQALLQILANL